MIRRILLFLAVAVISSCGVANAQVEFKRELEQVSFVPKGQWITGVSVSFSQSSQDNYQFFIVEGIDGDAYTMKVSPMLMYCFKDNLAAGGKFSYTRTRTHLNSANVVIDSETNYDVDNLYQVSQNYSAMACFRNYFSFGRSHRFGMFNEVQMQFGGGQSKILNGSGDDLTGTYSKSWNMNIGLAPGLVMFLNNYSAVEVNVGLLGFNYSHTKNTTDQIYDAKVDNKNANFKINLFSITFGVTFYL